jgi:hypothetical protein
MRIILKWILRDVGIQIVDWFCCTAIGDLVNMAVGSEKQRDLTGK